MVIDISVQYNGGLLPDIVVVVVFFTLTDRASTIPSDVRGCQSGTWSQRGIKVNGPHHGDNPLLGPTGIQIATKSYATLQAMAPTNNKKRYIKPPLLHIESSLDRLGFLSPNRGTQGSCWGRRDLWRRGTKAKKRLASYAR